VNSCGHEAALHRHALHAALGPVCTTTLDMRLASRDRQKPGEPGGQGLSCACGTAILLGLTVWFCRQPPPCTPKIHTTRGCGASGSIFRTPWCCLIALPVLDDMHVVTQQRQAQRCTCVLLHAEKCYQEHGHDHGSVRIHAAAAHTMCWLHAVPLCFPAARFRCRSRTSHVEEAAARRQRTGRGCLSRACRQPPGLRPSQ